MKHKRPDEKRPETHEYDIEAQCSCCKHQKGPVFEPKIINDQWITNLYGSKSPDIDQTRIR